MKKATFLTCLFLIMGIGLSFSQSDDRAFHHIDYYKVDSGNMEAFEALVKSEWKTQFNSEIETNRLVEWTFYKVIYPGGQSSDYNYVLINTYNSLNAIPEVNTRLSQKFSKNKRDVTNKTRKLARHQFSELWTTEGAIINISENEWADFMVMNYMMVTPGKEAEYLTLENDMARPVHEARVNKGTMHSWKTFSLIQPGGVNYGYNFATADYYKKLEGIEFGFTNELIKSVLPGTDINEMFDAIYATRDIAKSELWQLLDSSK